MFDGGGWGGCEKEEEVDKNKDFDDFEDDADEDFAALYFPHNSTLLICFCSRFLFQVRFSVRTTSMHVCLSPNYDFYYLSKDTL